MLNFLIWNWIQHKIFRHVKTVERSILLFFLPQKMIKRGQNCHENFVTFRRKWYVQIVSWFADLPFILTSTEEQNSTYLFFLDKKNVVFFKVGQLHVNVKEGGRFTKITIAEDTRSRTACHSEQNLFEKWHFLLFVSLIQGYKIKKGIESLLIFQRKCLKIFPTFWTDFVHSELVL